MMDLWKRRIQGAAKEKGIQIEHVHVGEHVGDEIFSEKRENAEKKGHFVFAIGKSKRKEGECVRARA